MPEREYRPLLDALEARLGTQIALSVAGEDYEALVDRLVDGEVDLAILHPFMLVRARRRAPGVEIVASFLTRGGTTYRGYVVVRDADPARRIDDLRGRRFAYVDAASTSGYLVPRAILARAGHDPDAFFGETVFAGKHRSAAELVLAGEVDGAAVVDEVVRDVDDLAGLRVIAKSDPIPNSAVAARPGLPPAEVAAVRAALLAISTRTDEGRAALGHGRLPWHGFGPGRIEDYEHVAALAADAGAR